MFSFVKKIIYASIFLLLLSCNKGKKLISHSVGEIAVKNPREIEEMESFYVTGKVDVKINVGCVKTFRFVDVKDEGQAIFIISNHKSLPSNHQESTLKVKLYREIAFNDGEFLIFEEVKVGAK